MAFTEYVTRQNQRWDTIAWEVYGDPYGYEAIVFANPQYGNQAQLAAGITLQIPAIERSAPTIAPELLPPWKR